jgi:MscS family membrane protein
MIEETIDKILANKYIAASLIFITLYAMSEIVVVITEKIVLSLTKRTKTKIDDEIVRKIKKPLSLLLISIGAQIGWQVLSLESNTAEIISRIIASFTTVIVIYILTSILNIFIKHLGTFYAKKTKSKLDKHIIDLLSRANTVVFLIAALLGILKVWGIEVGPLLAGLGIGGIAIAFAMQKSLGNIFGGISLILDRSINIDDVVLLDDGTEGKVIDVGLRSTKIQTLKNEVISIPNGKLEEMKIQNLVKPDPSLVVVIKFGIAYGTNIEKARKIAEEAIKKVPELKKDKEIIIRFKEMGNSSLNFTASFWIADYNKRYDAENNANTLVYNALRKNKIEIPFPQMDVRIKK